MHLGPDAGLKLGSHGSQHAHTNCSEYQDHTSISVLVPNTASRKSTCRLYVRSSPTTGLLRCCCLRIGTGGRELGGQCRPLLRRRGAELLGHASFNE